MRITGKMTVDRICNGHCFGQYLELRIRFPTGAHDLVGQKAIRFIYNQPKCGSYSGRLPQLLLHVDEKPLDIVECKSQRVESVSEAIDNVNIKSLRVPCTVGNICQQP